MLKKTNRFSKFDSETKIVAVSKNHHFFAFLE